MIQMFHAGTGMVLETVNDCEQLRPAILQTRNVQAMITTGAGTSKIAAVNGNGDFLFSPDTILMTQHATYQSDNEKGAAMQVDVWRPFLTFFVQAPGKGWRQVGVAQLDMLAVLKAACDEKPFEIAGELFVATAKSDTTTVKLCLTSQASPLERTQLQAWLNNNEATVTLLGHRTVSTEEVTKQLKLHMKTRTAKMTKCMNGMYGSLDKQVKLDRVDLRRDSCCVLNTCDPGQMQELMKALDLNKQMFRKLAVPIVTAQLLAVAELCASQQTAGPAGAQTITVSMLRSMLARHTKASMSKQEAVATQQLFPRLITKFEGACTFYETSFAGYLSDEGWAFDGSNVKAIEANSEKMDVSGGKPAAHFLLTAAAFAANDETLRKLLEQHKKTPASAGDALAELDAQISTLKQEQYAIRNTNFYGECDCEDGAIQTKIIMEVSTASPRDLNEIVQPHVGTAILPLHKMYAADSEKPTAPPGRLMHVGSAAPQEVRDRARTGELRDIVRMTTQLISDALKWQSEPVNGKRISYEVCLGLASAPSMPSADTALSTIKVTRELCSSRPEYYSKLFARHTLCGHCFASAVVTSDARQTPDGVQTKIVEFSANSLLEKTMTNVRVGFRSRDDPLYDNASKTVLANKSVQITIDGHCLELHNIPHAQIRANVAHVVQAQLAKCLAKEYTVHGGMRMDLGKSFYNFVSQVGVDLAVTGECTSKTQTSTLDAKATADEMHLACSMASFSESTLAWDACPQSNVTRTAVLSVPLCREEKERIAQLAHELTPIHTMTKEQLDNILTLMGHTVSVGFEGGTFTGTDWSGESLDSDNRVALAFVLQMLPQTYVHADYANADVSASTVLRAKLELLLPGTCMRVKEVETGAFLLQVMVQV
jgi:hypothetical protein